eukprot:gnl/Chilomastix_caulleri/5875.p1 GENE.gnl/Chilomastix_caulleri/5875~~gnl/Chilomastix_caulleri/5875.p1  ORF type:complete len:111 (-),score=15.00 gnl/Chilomastix_caulleri/5875:93-425(-)
MVLPLMVKIPKYQLVQKLTMELIGSSGSIENETAGSPILTDYVATRWYRAPEILLGSPTYGYNVDMWSCGCVLGEMLCGSPIFRGSSTMDQLDKIVTVLGVPTEEDLQIY